MMVRLAAALRISNCRRATNTITRRSLSSGMVAITSR